MFFVKPTDSLLIQETRTQWDNLEAKFDCNKYLHFVNLFHCKPYTRGIFKSQSNFHREAFLCFSQRSSTVNAQLCSKYAPAYS